MDSNTNTLNDYELITKNAYRDEARATSYREEYESRLTWMHLMMRRERSNVAKAIDFCNLKESDIVLDAPCGTGTLAEVFSSRNLNVIGSDISFEMMDCTSKEEFGDKCQGFFQSDILSVPLADNSVQCVTCIGLMHRLPPEIRNNALKEISRVSSEYAIVTYSIGKLLNKIKNTVLGSIWKTRKGAPHPSSARQVEKEIYQNGFEIVKRLHTFPVLSSSVVYLLRKNK